MTAASLFSTDCLTLTKSECKLFGVMSAHFPVKANYPSPTQIGGNKNLK